VFADGSTTPPLLILGRNYLPTDLESFVISDKWSVIGGSSAWMTKEVFAKWALESYLKEITKRRAEINDPNAPALLILDGHSSRECPEVLKKLKEDNIHVLTLVSHASHILQPLDVEVFAVLKACLRSRWNTDEALNLLEAMRRSLLLRATKSALYHAVDPETVLTGWRKAGLQPVDRNIPLGHGAVNRTETADIPVNHDLDENGDDEEKQADDDKENEGGAQPARRSRFYISSRLLTSEVALKELQEREENKKKEEEDRKARQEQKAKRKAEREEEAKKRKLEKEQQKQAKLAEKEKQKAEKDKNKAQKLEEKESKKKKAGEQLAAPAVASSASPAAKKLKSSASKGVQRSCL
jgi:hypothetical protein